MKQECSDKNVSVSRSSPKGGAPNCPNMAPNAQGHYASSSRPMCCFKYTRVGRSSFKSNLPHLPNVVLLCFTDKAPKDQLNLGQD